VLADDDPDWRPTRYVVQLKRTRLTFEFEPVHLLDWTGREEELLAHPNPAALFVLAHLKSRQTKGDPGERARAKRYLISRLHGWKLDAEEMRQWNRDTSSTCSPAEVEDQSTSPRQRASVRNPAGDKTDARSRRIIHGWPEPSPDVFRLFAAAVRAGAAGESGRKLRLNEMMPNGRFLSSGVRGRRAMWRRS
jgi:hypothetical protein